jgi:hypothetical protein
MAAILSSVNALPCGTDVYGLYSTENQIYAYIKNTGNTSQMFNYTFYVDGVNVNMGTINISAGATQQVSHTYNFGTGRHTVRIEAISECGSEDYESLVHTQFEYQDCDEPRLCIEGATRCDCTQKKVYECRDNEWELLAHGENEFCEICGQEGCCGLPEPCWNCETCGCDDGCDDGNCDPQDEDCGVFIEQFNYIDNIKENGSAQAEAVVRNTGDHREVITVKLYIDGLLKDSNSVSVAAGKDFARTFYFRPAVGTHRIEIAATTECGSVDFMDRTINVIDLGEHIEPPKPAPAPSPSQTTIEITPASLDIPRYDVRVIVVNIHSSIPQYFRIDVRDGNFDNGWLDYEGEFYVDGDRSAYIYVTPAEYGNYGMDVYVTGRTEWKTVKQHVTFYVAAPKEAETSVDFFADLPFILTSPGAMLIALLTSIAAVIYTGTRLFSPKPDAWKA